MNTYTLTDKELLAFIKVALDEKTVLNVSMKEQLLVAAEDLVLTEAEEIKASKNAYNVYHYATYGYLEEIFIKKSRKK